MIELTCRLIGAGVVSIVLYPVAINAPTMAIGTGVACLWLVCMLVLFPSRQ